ncbi:YjeO family protein [Serratia sp. L9]|uniref:YjeO family protein n=1 Tax=Serratia sp. L9 TaxID=3423946 RepID=UPI003D66466F
MKYSVCLLSILVLSYVDKKDFIDGDEVKDICDVRRMSAIDDTRDVTASLTMPFILPFIYLVVRRKLRSSTLNVALFLLIAFWLWRFFIRFAMC